MNTSTTQTNAAPATSGALSVETYTADAGMGDPAAEIASLRAAIAGKGDK